MKILSADQTHAADQATIKTDRISSLDLMERAATALADWLMNRLSPSEAGEAHVLCGPGNNGGDGLVLARLLHLAGYAVRVWLLPADKRSADCQANLDRLPANIPQAEVAEDALPTLPDGTLVVDALFGTGLSRPLEGVAAALVRHLHKAKARVLAVDIPSGLFTDAPQPADSVIVRAYHTVSFELPKLAFLLPHNAEYVGQWHLVPIGLDAKFLAKAKVEHYFVDAAFVAGKLPRRAMFSHKGMYGHALLLAGSNGKMGACVLATRACLRSGVGLLTVRTPGIGYDVLQTTAPEAMALVDPNQDHLTELPALKSYDAVGMGPGMGQEDATRVVLEQLLREAGEQQLALVLDADALNLLGTHRELLDLLPPDTVLTPHPKEFERLTEPARDDYHRLELLRNFCQKYRCYCVLKGAYTCLGTPDGPLYFNSTGSPGMASGGSGDALTGVLTALRAQSKHLSPLDACLLSIYAHGRAGTLAAEALGEASSLAHDLIEKLGLAFQELTAPEEW
ncbi:NAD(P)H-hydrate dehydratase [Hymenobacter aerilatus]|uniref:Bifunctional NAD(P)H-hydrate repair enzyme n=1 Tax=Hymenobacter aerilatus TaxID=2932251 RepID=A0A8T9SSU6_9BACT|nr:NAD(P)H-hydrate dehydratase [Hymenobacter aerilatus]UOR04421.1 NAD(P)H-hydrate dehydratase [Hymenobacter aerilatus]